MAVWTPAARVRRRYRASDRDIDNRLAFMDQASFLGLRATGQGQTIQCVWFYRRPIDLDALRRFNRNLGCGLLGRRIERSPLPFARHRWVSCPASPDIDVAKCARPPGDLSAWADERGQVPVDPERGPGWHLGVLPLTDGSAAISLAASHTVVDGGGFCLAVADAVRGDTRDLGYPPPASRTRRRAVIEDARQTAQGVPEIVRTLRTAAKLARRRRREFTRARPSRPVEAVADADEAVNIPAITIYVDVGDWDARAYSLGGTSNSLLAGFTAKLAEHAERRRRIDGAVNLSFPVSDREEGDVRANALAFADVTVDPASVTTDLSSVRAAVKQTLKTLRETPDESLQLLPLTPLTPKRAVRRLAEVAFGYDELPVGCSNLGDIDPAVACPDGAAADEVFIRLVEQHTTRASVARTRGVLYVASGRIVDKVFLTVAAYQPDRKNSKSDLRQLAARALAEFELVGAID